MKIWLIASLFLTGFLHAQPPQWFAAAALEKAPDLSRGLADPAWEKALKIPFARLENSSADSQKFPTESYWLYAGGSLFAAFKCANPASPKLWAVPNQTRDQPVYQSESVELFLGNFTGDFYYQFIVDAQGNVFDGQLGSPKWDGDWKHHVERQDGYWTVIFEIPAALLGTIWTPGSFLNIDMTRHGFNADGSGAETMALTEIGLHSPENKLFLGKVNPAELGVKTAEAVAHFQKDFRNTPLPETVSRQLPPLAAFATECKKMGDIPLDRYRELYAQFVQNRKQIQDLEQELVLDLAFGKEGKIK